ncbi:hypothetical protein D3C74_254860 [compost metagenome]
MKCLNSISGITIIGLIIFLVSGCSNNLNSSELSSYKDKTFNFIVHYPAGWSSVIEETWEGTEERESNPDGGIIIYVESNKDDSIRVFGQHGHISLPTEGFVQEDFYTSSGEKGLLFSNELMDEKEIYFIMDSGFNGAHIRVSNDSFKRNEEKIMNVLRSIELIND